MPIAAQFEIEFLQYLDAGGQPVRDALPADSANPQTLLALFKQMLYVRTFDSKAVALQRTGKLGTYASCLGHEATHVGIGASMRRGDVLAPSYREYGAMFMRGVRPREILLYWGGDERGSDFQRDSDAARDFPICVPISTQCLHAAGAALAFKAARRGAGGGGHLRRRRLVQDRLLRRAQLRRRLPVAADPVRDQQRLGDLGAAHCADRRADPGAEGPGRRPALPAGGRQRPDRGAGGDAPGARARAGRPGRHGDRVHDLPAVRPHHRRRRAPLPRRCRGQAGLGTRSRCCACAPG